MELRLDHGRAKCSTDASQGGQQRRGDGHGLVYDGRHKSQSERTGNTHGDMFDGWNVYEL